MFASLLTSNYLQSPALTIAVPYEECVSVLILVVLLNTEGEISNISLRFLCNVFSGLIYCLTTCFANLANESLTCVWNTSWKWSISCSNVCRVPELDASSFSSFLLMMTVSIYALLIRNGYSGIILNALHILVHFRIFSVSCWMCFSYWFCIFFGDFLLLFCCKFIV